VQARGARRSAAAAFRGTLTQKKGNAGLRARGSVTRVRAEWLR
jgi:hypothetical protein